MEPLRVFLPEKDTTALQKTAGRHSQYICKAPELIEPGLMSSPFKKKTCCIQTKNKLSIPLKLSLTAADYTERKQVSQVTD